MHKELVCTRCSKDFIGYHNRRYCDHCAYTMQLEAKRAYNERMQAVADRFRKEPEPIVHMPDRPYAAQWQVKRHGAYWSGLDGQSVPDNINIDNEESVLIWLHSFDEFQSEHGCPVCIDME